MEEYVYYMFNKPKGCITAKKDMMHKTVMDYFSKDEPENLHPVGRLDKDTEGLLVFTNDGMFNQRLMHPDYHVSKKYYFHALGCLDTVDIDKLSKGIVLRGESLPTCGATVEIEGTGNINELKPFIEGTKFEKAARNPRNGDTVSGFITISQGKKHQVKRMLKAVGCYVIYLKRIAIGGLELDRNLEPGQYRKLTENEMKNLLIKPSK